MAHLGTEAGGLGLAEPGAESLLERPGAAGGASESRLALPFGSRAAKSVPGPRGRVTVDIFQSGAAAANGRAGAGHQAE